MTNKIIKLLGIILIGAGLFAAAPYISYAQYYPYYTYGATSYAPLNITTTKAINITGTSVILNGQVNGSILYSTYNLSTWFQYGTTTNLENSTVHTPSNSGYADLSSNVANLSPNTVYYFRAVGQNSQGVVYGNTNSFRTNFASVTDSVINIDNNTNSGTLTAVTAPATSVSSHSAKLNSLILNATGGADTWFEYGTSSNLDKMTTPISTGALSSVKHVNTLFGLAPGTTYYFRAIVLNSASRNDGSTLSFVTSGSAPSASTNKSTKTPAITSGGDTITKASPEETKSYLGSLGASVFSSGSFLPINIFGWLILLILILTLMLLGKKHLFSKSLEQK